MQKLLLLTIFSVLLLSCSINRESILCKKMYSEKCDQVKVASIADCNMEKSGYNLDILTRHIVEADTFFLVQYLPKDTLIRGGGAEVKITKNCKIVGIKRYQ